MLTTYPRLAGRKLYDSNIIKSRYFEFFPDTMQSKRAAKLPNELPNEREYQLEMRVETLTREL
jgi:hypothetical protein